MQYMMEYPCISIDVGNSTTIYAHREGNSPHDDMSCGTELQYLVKWVNWSHLHNTWETGMSAPSVCLSVCLCERVYACRVI